MPRKLHNPDQILDRCLGVFAEHGYDATSMAMLAGAAGVSKALLFHHFEGKPGVYLSLVDRSIELARAALDPVELAAFTDFFEARERFSLMKVRFGSDHPDTYRLLLEAFLDTPEPILEDIRQRHDAMAAERREGWRKRFDRVPLRRGVRRSEAFELIMLATEHFERRYVEQMTAATALDDRSIRRFLGDRRRFLELIRHGIQAGVES